MRSHFQDRGFCYCSRHAQYLSNFLHPDLLIRERECLPVYDSINPWTARVVHLDHGYFFSVKTMPIQQMTYAAASIFWHSLILPDRHNFFTSTTYRCSVFVSYISADPDSFLSKQGLEKLKGDCSYNDQCSVFSKTAFVQIGPQTRRVWEWLFIDNFRATRASRAASEASPLDARAPNAE